MRINMRIIDLLTVCYDTETDELVLRVNEQSVNIYKRKYGLIGQTLERLGKHVQRKEWPHFLSNAVWTHIIPKNDIIAHNLTGYKCSCNPRVNVINKEILHVAMDPGISSFLVSPESWEKHK